jgi:hypothetical protein
MTRSKGNPPRKPATKFAHLRKKQAQNRIKTPHPHSSRRRNPPK